MRLPTSISVRLQNLRIDLPEQETSAHAFPPRESSSNYTWFQTSSEAQGVRAKNMRCDKLDHGCNQLIHPLFLADGNTSLCPVQLKTVLGYAVKPVMPVRCTSCAWVLLNNFSVKKIYRQRYSEFTPQPLSEDAWYSQCSLIRVTAL